MDGILKKIRLSDAFNKENRVPFVKAIVLMSLFTFTFLGAEFLFVNVVSRTVSGNQSVASQNYALGVSAVGFVLYPLFCRVCRGRVQSAVKAATETAAAAVAEKRAAMDELSKVIAERDSAHQRIRNNATNLQFVQEAFNANHPALAGEWGADLSHGALLLWDWYRQIGKGLLQDFPLFDEDGLGQVEHCCEWCLNQDRKRLHSWLKGNGHV